MLNSENLLPVCGFVSIKNSSTGCVSVGTKVAIIFSIFDVKNLLNLSASTFGSSS